MSTPPSFARGLMMHSNSKERALKFNDEMLAALLAGKKTQTRRPIDGFDVFELVNDGAGAGMWRVHGQSLQDVNELNESDEVIGTTPAGTYEKSLVRPKFIDYYCPYTLGGHFINACNKDGDPVCGIYVNVSVERLQAITLGDICKEFGCGLYDFRPATYGFQAWEELWESIYGADTPKSWQANPWVWVIEFKRVQEQSND